MFHHLTIFCLDSINRPFFNCGLTSDPLFILRFTAVFYSSESSIAVSLIIIRMLNGLVKIFLFIQPFYQFNPYFMYHLFQKASSLLSVFGLKLKPTITRNYSNCHSYPMLKSIIMLN